MNHEWNTFWCSKLGRDVTIKTQALPPLPDLRSKQREEHSFEDAIVDCSDRAECGIGYDWGACAYEKLKQNR